MIMMRVIVLVLLCATTATAAPGDKTIIGPTSNLVPNTRKVAGKALTTDITLTASDVGLGNVTNDAQTKAAILPNTAPTPGRIPIGNVSGTAYVPVAVSGDGALASTGALTITKSNGSAFGTAAFTATSAYDAAGAAASVTTASIGAVPASRTVNGQALSSDVTITTISGNAGTATALAANGTNCSAGQAALGVDASGNSEGCWTPAGAYTLPAATAAVLGGVKPDGTSITNTSGAISITRSATVPVVDGTAAVGVSNASARADHVHPTDTSRAATNQTMNIGTTAVAINRASGSLALTGITSIDGSAAKWTLGRTLSITGPITYTSPSFDGSGNVTAAATVTSQTGTGSKFVMDTSPTLVAPNITTGVTINGTTQLTGYKEGTWTPIVTGLTVVGAPTYTGYYTRVGRLVSITLEISATTSTSSTGYGVSYVIGIPYTNARHGTGSAVNTNAVGYANPLLATPGTLYLPPWGSTDAHAIISIVYETNDSF